LGDEGISMSDDIESRRSNEGQSAAEKAEYEAGFDRARAADDVSGLYKEAADCHDIAMLHYLASCAAELPGALIDSIRQSLAYADGLLDGLRENPKFDQDVIDGVPEDADHWDPPEHECQ
jgi:hypothetical protein